MVVLEGTVDTHGGLHKASELLEAVQLPQFILYYPELAECFAGTINVTLDRAFRVATEDFSLHGKFPQAEGLVWDEVYRFVRVQIELPISAPLQKAWLYIPDRSPHVNKVHYVELLAPWMNGVADGVRCRLHIDKKSELAITIV